MSNGIKKFIATAWEAEQRDEKNIFSIIFSILIIIIYIYTLSILFLREIKRWIIKKIKRK